ncbi:MAG: prepilin-type N-terminal cleavage/methylation domain-containing protein [Phycisphaerae bacterium]
MRHVRPQSGASSRGFTLVELVVATVIAVIIAGATAVSMSQMVKAKTASSSHQQAFARAEAVASRMALDLSNVVRDPDLAQCRLRVVSGGDGPGQRDELLVLMRSLRNLRPRAVEGDEYEAQYRISPSPDPQTPGDWFWRRVDQAHDDYQDGGGIAAPIALGAVSLDIVASDGVDWFESWDSDSSGLPHAIRLTVVADSDDRKTRATVRRVVAIDRVPIAPVVDETQTPAAKNPASGQGGGSSPASGSGSSGGTSSGGGGGTGGGTGGTGGAGGGGGGTPSTGGTPGGTGGGSAPTSGTGGGRTPR